MADYTLAEFLRRQNLLGRFREEVASDLLYLRSVLGDAFFTNTGAEGFSANPMGSPPPGDAFRVHTVKEKPNESLRMDSNEPEWEEDWDGYDQRVEDENLECIHGHLLDIEKALLGSKLFHPKDKDRPTGNVTRHTRRVGLVPRTDIARADFLREGITPITAMLGEGRVDHGGRGAIGGYSSSGKHPGYRTPVDGTPRRLPLDALNEVLAGFKGLKPESNHCIFAGSNFEDRASFPLEEGSDAPLQAGGELSPVKFYKGDPLDPALQTRVLFSPGMPDDAVYVIAPGKVFLSASPFCNITTNETGKRITALYSKVCHSLLHPQHGPDLERYHYAFLAVRPPKEDSGD